MEIPNSWNDILVDQYIELRELNLELPYFDLMLETISIVTDTDIDELEELSFTELIDIEKKLTWLTSEPSKNITKQIGNKKFIGFDNLTLGEFIDLNHYFSANFVTNLPTICGILYRQQKKNEWNELITEPYDYDPRNRADLFTEVGIVQVYGIIGTFLEYKSNFEETYSTLFKPDLSDEDIDDLDEETKKDIEEEERLDTFSWERLIYSICQDFNTTPEQTLNMSVIFVFNMLSMKKALNI